MEHWMTFALEVERRRRLEDAQRAGESRAGRLVREVGGVVERPRGVPPGRWTHGLR